MNVKELVAIDVHTHAEVSSRDPTDEATQSFEAAAKKYFKETAPRPTIPEAAAYYRARKIACIIFTVDSEKATGRKRISNEEVAELANANGDVRLKYGDPMPIDDVAVDFPDMPIILAHPSWPWQDAALSICLHKPQVYIDLSGWSPKYFPPQLVQYANTQLKHKVLFGSDYPLITPDRWLADFDKAGFRDEVKPLILKENAAKLLKLA